MKELTKMKRAVTIIATFGVFLSAMSCKRPLQMEQIVVPDASASIEPEGAEAMWRLMDVLALKLQRGDSLLAMPITGDAGNDLSGHTLRAAAPTLRERQ